jgi:redox-sensitive bicupin YhaK (pirin superfamily)
MRAMIQTSSSKRSAQDRGRTQLSWLESSHTFSFGDYRDPDHHSFRSLRVINEDVVAPGHGFPQHAHRNMEIVTFVVSGELTHQDSMGHTKSVGAGGMQYMSAGSGLTHSEFNASKTNPVHFLQIWITPHALGLKPAYAEWSGAAQDRGPLTLIASGEKREGALALRQDATIQLGKLAAGESFTYRTQPDRGLWFQMIEGELEVNGESLRAGDGLAVEGVSQCELTAARGARFLLFDLA